MRIILVLSYCLMVLVNALANGLPINGLTTGEVSNQYANIFAPAGFTFAIWGIIYVLLGIFTVYQFKTQYFDQLTEISMKELRTLVVAINILNAGWILAWHYLLIELTVVIMLLLLLVLIKSVNVIEKMILSTDEKRFIKVPFTVYLAWICVATIANVTALLVHYNWNGFGIAEEAWAAAMIVIGMFIAITGIRSLKSKDFGFVFMWAYLGILYQHVHANGFHLAYPIVVVTASLACAVLGMTVYAVCLRNKDRWRV